MPMLSEDDLNLRDLSDEELARAWDLWFDLAQATNDWDPPYSHGVLVGMELPSDGPVPHTVVHEESGALQVAPQRGDEDGAGT